MLLGSTNLNSTTVHQRQDEIAQWGDSMTDNGDILLYGCLTANDKFGGVEFVDSLAAITHADMAASTGKVGDGSWDLNYHTGSIEAGVIVTANRPRRTTPRPWPRSRSTRPATLWMATSQQEM